MMIKNKTKTKIVLIDSGFAVTKIFIEYSKKNIKTITITEKK